MGEGASPWVPVSRRTRSSSNETMGTVKAAGTVDAVRPACGGDRSEENGGAGSEGFYGTGWGTEAESQARVEDGVSDANVC